MQPIHRRIFRIADDQALLVVEHREALRHALQGGIETVTRSLVQRTDHAVDHEQHQSRQHDAGQDRTQQQQIGLVGKRLDVVARLQADVGILLVQPLHLLLDIGYPILQLRRVRSEVEEIGDVRPDVQSLGARAGRTRPFDRDVHIVQHCLQELIGLGRLVRSRGAGAFVDIVLKRDLREADIVGGDEGGIVDVHGIVDDRALLVAREQADHRD